ncbi:MAG: phosphate acyltransferase, partial [Hyphomicrobium sp.]
VDGELRGDAALSRAVLEKVLPDSRLKREANLLIMPTVDAANIAYNLLKIAAGNGITVGPILLGTAKPAHMADNVKAGLGAMPDVALREKIAAAAAD